MPKVTVYDMTGKSVGERDLSEAVFGIAPNEAVLHAVVKNFLANQRQGTQSTRTRTEVKGGGRKPWRQKGTGRARQGSTRAPQWTHGGIALGPKPRSYRHTLNKKTRALAVRSALSAKVQENALIVVDQLKADAYKTKTVVNMLGAQHVDDRFGLVGIRLELIHHNQRVLLHLGGESGTHGKRAGLLIEGVAVAAGLGAECDAAVSPLRRAGGTLSCTSGSLLSPGLSAAALHLGAGAGGLGALTLVGKEVLHHRVQNGLVRSDPENGFGKVSFPNAFAGHIVNCNLRHGLFPPSLSLLHAVGDIDDPALGAGDRTLQRDQIVFCVHLDHVKVLYGNSLYTHVSGKLFTLHDTGGGGAGAHGTDMTMHGAGAVGVLEGVEVVAFDGAGVAFTFGGAAYVHAVARRKGVCLDDVADVHGALIGQTEFAQVFLGRNVRFRKVAFERLVDALVADVAKTELHGFIAVVFGRFLLDNDAGAGFHDSYGNHVAFFVKKLGHADFFADDAFFHCCFLLFRLLVGSL